LKAIEQIVEEKTLDYREINIRVQTEINLITEDIAKYAKSLISEDVDDNEEITITEELESILKKRNKLYRKYTKDPNETKIFDRYTKYRNQASKLQYRMKQEQSKKMTAKTNHLLKENPRAFFKRIKAHLNPRGPQIPSPAPETFVNYCKELFHGEIIQQEDIKVVNPNPTDPQRQTNSMKIKNTRKRKKQK